MQGRMDRLSAGPLHALTSHLESRVRAGHALQLFGA